MGLLDFLRAAGPAIGHAFMGPGERYGFGGQLLDRPMPPGVMTLAGGAGGADGGPGGGLLDLLGHSGMGLPASESGQGQPLGGPTPPGVGMTPSAPGQLPMPNAPQSQAHAPALLPDAHRSIMDRLLPVPAGLEGLLSDGDISSARRNAVLAFGTSLLDAGGPHVGQPAPSLGQALAHGLAAGMNGYNQGLDGAAQRNTGTIELRQKLADIARKQQFQQRAASLMQPGMTQDQRYEAWQQLAADAASAGVDLGPISQIVTATKPPVPKPLEFRDLGNQTVGLDPRTGQPVVRYPNGPRPVDPEVQATRELIASGVRDSRTLRASQAYANSVQNTDKVYAGASQGMAAARIARTYVQPALALDPQAQMDLIGNAVKAQHPGAVVRPGEIARTEDGRPLTDEVGAWWNKIQSGAHLTRAQVQHIADMNERIYSQHEATAKTRLQQARQYMQKHGLYDDILFDPTQYPQTGDYRTGGRAAGPTGTNPYDLP